MVSHKYGYKRGSFNFGLFGRASQKRLLEKKNKNKK